jgi:hypothetical protein
MKIFILAVLAMLVFSTCKKDKSPEKQALVSRASYNGLNAYRFSYSADNHLIKWELFNTDPQNNSITAYIQFDYNANGQMEKLSTFQMPGAVPVGHIIFGYDNAGKVISFESYDLQGANPSEPYRHAVFQYNAQNQLTTATIRDDDDELIRQYSLSYYPNGFLKERNEYEETITDQLRLAGRVIYSIPLTNEFKGWEKLDLIPLDGDELTRRVKYEGIQRYTYNNGVLMNNISEAMSGKEYNTDGTLKRQVSTVKSILPANPDVVNNWEYEYIHQ